jgi:hypothetical protein
LMGRSAQRGPTSTRVTLDASAFFLSSGITICRGANKPRAQSTLLDLHYVIYV